MIGPRGRVPRERVLAIPSTMISGKSQPRRRRRAAVSAARSAAKRQSWQDEVATQAGANGLGFGVDGGVDAVAGAPGRGMEYALRLGVRLVA